MSLLLLFGGAGSSSDDSGGAAGPAGVRVAVEVGFGATWKTADSSITWTDVTTDVRDAEIASSRGRREFSQQFSTGELHLTLLNLNRSYDPNHTAGAHFGNLLPGVPIRVRVTPDSQSTVTVWRGFVSGWPQSYDVSNKVSVVPLRCYGIFDKLARASIPRSVLEVEMLADGPEALYMLDETSGMVMLDRSGNGWDGTYTHGTTSLSEELVMPGGGVVRGIRFDGEHKGTSSFVLRGTGLAETLTVSFVAQPEADDILDTGSRAWETGDGNLANRTSAALATDEARMRDRSRNTGNLVEGISTISDDLTDAHHYAIRVATNGAQDGFVDGDNASTETLETDIVRTVAGTRIGGWKETGYEFTGFLAAVGFYEAALSDSRIEAHYDAANAPLDGQTTDQRIDWVLDQIGLPDDRRDFETGQTPLGPANFQAGDRALDYVRLVEQTEAGRLFETADGKLRFLNRHYSWTATKATVVQATFSDDGGTDIPYAAVDVEFDDEHVINVARGSRRGGAELVVTDSDSIDAYGEIEGPQQLTDLLVATDSQVRSLLQWRVATRKAPVARIPKLTVFLDRLTAAQQATLLGLEIGDRINIERTPQNVGSTIDTDWIIEGVDHSMTLARWRVDLYVSPAPDAEVELFTLGTSELDGTHILAF